MSAVGRQLSMNLQAAGAELSKNMDLAQGSHQPTAVAPALANMAGRLEKAQRRDSLKGMLSARQSPQQLANKNIGVSTDSNLAPGLPSKKKALEKAMTSDKLDKLIANRPTADDMTASTKVQPAGPSTNTLCNAMHSPPEATRCPEHGPAWSVPLHGLCQSATVSKTVSNCNCCC
jgi:hypothetical protein